MLFTLFLAVNLKVLASFFYSFTFAALLDIIITLVYLNVFVFYCFQFCENGEFSCHKCLEPSTFVLRSKALPTDVAGLEHRHVTHYFLFLIWTVSQVFSSPKLLRLLVIHSGSHQSTHSFGVLLFPVCERGVYSSHKILEFLTLGIKV